MTEVGKATFAIDPDLKGFGGKLSAGIGPQISSLGRSAGTSFGGSFKGVAGAAIAGLGVGAGVAKLLSDSISEARESQKVNAVTTSTIKATGGAAKISAGQVGDLATAISNKTGIDDETIQSGANLLLTFKGVRNEVGAGNDVFNQATQAATDLSAAGFGSVTTTSKQLGKALNDPVKGIAALSKSGVTFTDQQKTQIKAMVKNGDTLGAQKIILGEVKSEVGGVAAASATSGEKFQTAFKNVQEQLGTALLPTLDKVLNFFTTSLIPVISNGLTSIGPTVSAVVGFFQQWGPVLLPIAGIVLGVIAAIKVWTIVQTALNVVMSLNPIGLVVIAIGALVVGLIYAYKHSETFRTVVQTVFSAVKGFIVSAINVAKTVIHSLVTAFEVTKAAVSSFFSAVVSRFNAIKSGISNAVNSAKSAVSSAFSAIVSAVASKVAAVVSKVSELKNKIVNAFKSANTILLNVGKNLIDGLINGIKNNASAVISALKGVVSDAINAAKNALGIHSPSKVFFAIGGFVSEGLANGIASSAGLVSDATAGLGATSISSAGVRTSAGGSRVSGSPMASGGASSGTPQGFVINIDGMRACIEGVFDEKGEFNGSMDRMYR